MNERSLCLLQVLSLVYVDALFALLLQKVTEEKYEVKIEIDSACIKIVTTTEPKVTVTVTLTSPVMRDTPEGDKGNVITVLLSKIGALLRNMKKTSFLRHFESQVIYQTKCRTANMPSFVKK